MKKFSLVMFLFLVLFLNSKVNAQTIDSSLKLVSENVKYYKIITVNNNNLAKTFIDNSVVEEISKAEYESSNSVIPYSDGRVETNYKKLTSSIYQTSYGYRYQAQLEWKTIPSNRSYDILAIGFAPNVAINSTINFNQYYCFSSGDCRNNSASYLKSTSTGGGAFYKLPEGSLTTLKSSIYFDVRKNVNAVIKVQNAYADSSHSVSSISSSYSQSYNINSSGIVLDSSIKNSFDSIPVSVANWSGRW